MMEDKKVSNQSTQENFNLSTIEEDLNNLFAVSEGLKNFVNNTMNNLIFGGAEVLQAKPEATREKERNRFKEIVFKIEDIRRNLNVVDADINALSDLAKK
ncbi:MAG: hypothetical protein PHE43_04750 [Candidatus Nanoarchaeia archaeon]|nr:hypothetical protein [Candidatus Nanoarchaeia archaeon]